MKYKFKTYWKYGFTLELEDGRTIYNEDQNASEIYRMGIEAEGEVTPTEDGKFLVDGTIFIV